MEGKNARDGLATKGRRLRNERKRSFERSRRACDRGFTRLRVDVEGTRHGGIPHGRDPKGNPQEKNRTEPNRASTNGAWLKAPKGAHYDCPL